MVKNNSAFGVRFVNNKFQVSVLCSTLNSLTFEMSQTTGMDILDMASEHSLDTEFDTVEEFTEFLRMYLTDPEFCMIILKNWENVPELELLLTIFERNGIDTNSLFEYCSGDSLSPRELTSGYLSGQGLDYAFPKEKIPEVTTIKKKRRKRKSK